MISEPTRLNALLDPILVPNDMQYLDSGILPNPPKVTDHCATYITLAFPYDLKPIYERKVYQYSKANFDLLRTNISSFNWDVLFNGTVDEACELFTKQFLTLIDACIPSQKVTIRPDDKPWFNGELRTLCRKRDRLKKLAFKTGKLSLLSKYKTIRNRINNMKKRAKQNFFKHVYSHYNFSKILYPFFSIYLE